MDSFVDCSTYSHSEFNLSTLKAHLRKPSFAKLLWLRAGLRCGLKETYMLQIQHEILVALNSPSSDHRFLYLAFKKNVMDALSHSKSTISTPIWTLKALQVLIFKGEWQRTAWESSFYKEKDKLCYPCPQSQHITDSVGIVLAAADYVVRPVFYNVVNTVFLSTVFLIHWCNWMQK